jgi:hypothetical protein
MIHSKFSFFLLTFMSWFDSCVSCSAPEPGLPDASPPATEEPDPIDSGEDNTGNPIPPPCDFPEQEPNDWPDEADEMQTELWACGVLAPDASSAGSESATDFVVFTAPESGWLSMWGRGEDIGSYTNLQMNVTMNRSTAPQFLGTVQHSPGTMDPKVTIPVDAGDVIDVALSGENFEGTDQQLWEFLPTILKEAPVYWNVVEAEDVSDPGANDRNDTDPSELQLLVTGDSIYGVLGQGDDADVFLFEVPEGGAEIEVDVEAYDAGSPINAKLAILREDEEAPGTLKQIRSNDNGREADLAPDPRIVHDATVGGLWRVRVTNVGTFASEYHWYVLHVRVSPTDGDTGTP